VATIPPNSTAGTITIQVVAEDSLEPDETFFVNLTGATGATIADNQAIGTIQTTTMVQRSRLMT
jgi:hypothetical protein